MNSKAEAQPSKFDTFKLATALVIESLAVGAFYYFTDQPLFIRVVGLLAATAVAIAVASQTDKGRQVAGFFRDANIEVRKVVWPTRQETVQTTLIVMVMVLIVAIFLWLLDMFLTWGVRILTGQGG